MSDEQLVAINEAARADAKEAEAYAGDLEKELVEWRADSAAGWDKCEEHRIKLAKAVELLKEARQDLEAYVTYDWPKDEHPYYDKKWERDMELCRRIDATLAEIKGDSHE